MGAAARDMVGRVILACAEWGLLVFAIGWGLEHFITGGSAAAKPQFGWDLDVYIAAARALAAGLDPYDSAVLHAMGVEPVLHFTSPPLIAWILGLFGRVAPWLMGPLLSTLTLVALTATPMLLARLFYPRLPAAGVVAIGASFAGFHCAGVTALFAVNMGTLLYLPIIATLADGLLRRRWTAFHIAVAIATVFKPFYAAFWLAPVLAHGFNFRQARVGAIAACASAAGYLLPALLTPTQFNAWLDRLSLQTLGSADVGESAFGAAFTTHWPADHPLAPYLVHLLFAAALVGLAATIRRPHVRWAALLVGVILINPRMKEYDQAIAAVPLVYLGGLLFSDLMGPRARLCLSAWFVCALLYLGDPDDILAAWAYPVLALALTAGAAAMAQRRDIAVLVGESAAPKPARAPVHATPLL